MKAFHAVVRYGAVLVFLVLVAGMCVLAWQNARKMPNIIVERMSPVGIEYNAEDVAMLNSGKSIPVMQRQLGEFSLQYEDTLSQPIAITGWHGDASTWEVFFATNRNVNPVTAGTDQVRFDNRVLEQSPHYGRAQIVLPWRRRGRDPQRGESSAEVAGQRKTVSFEKVHTLPWEAMAEGLQSQVSRSRQQDLLLFVHGFNVDFESALIRTAQIALDIPFNGAVVAYNWPSQGGARNYDRDAEINAKSLEPFTEFLQRLVLAVPAGTRINIVVHSMGNRLVMQAIGRLPVPDSHKPIANLVLCAPDVGLRDFKQWAPGVSARCERVTLYASRSDSALIASKEYVNFEQRAGDAHPPVCLPGIETIDVSAVDFDLLLGHSYYGSNLNVLSDLYFVVKEHRSAADRFYLTREPQGDRGGHYWYFQEEAPFIRCSWTFGEQMTR